MFYYGNLGDINTGLRTLDQWFNTANFERNAAKGPADRFQLRVDALNLANRAEFSATDTSPYSSNFAKITSQSNNMNRFIQLQGRIRF